MTGAGGKRIDDAPSAHAGYVGLARRERGAVLTGVMLGMAGFVALLFLLRPSMPPLPTVGEPALHVFDIVAPPPPPPPPAIPVASVARPAPTPGRPAGGSPGRARERPTQVALAPAPVLVDAPVTPLVRIDATLPAAGSSAFDHDGFGGLQGLGIGSGSGSGEGNGNGSGGGGGTADRLARAVWVTRPTRADYRREWPPGGDTVADPVDVLLVCAVTRGGRPHGCKVARDTRAGLGFGAAAIRLVEASRVRPVLRNGKRTDLPVIVPLRFTPR